MYGWVIANSSSISLKNSVHSINTWLLRSIVSLPLSALIEMYPLLALTLPSTTLYSTCDVILLLLLLFIVQCVPCDKHTEHTVLIILFAHIYSAGTKIISYFLFYDSGLRAGGGGHMSFFSFGRNENVTKVW